MSKSLFLVLLLSFSLNLSAQPGKPQNKPQLPSNSKSDRKYSSLLWEITGNGLKQPSYLFGTMHVSDKLAFHLGDSFYNALKSVQVVALETNPENWQDDFSKSAFFGRRGGSDNYFFSSFYIPNDKMNLNSFSIDDYNEAIKAALAVEPSLVNGLLYRTYGTQMDDFEEDTYLDMYIFQAGRKLGKKLTGVENFEESEKLVIEAYRDMLRDKNRKRRSFDLEDMYTNPKKIEDAYRKGDLDVMDSLQTMNVMSDAFEEKFLYKRNEIQAHSIDTILRKNSLFVAVGAAHLPGSRGVIEMLRKMGYKLRPVKMDDRNSIQKDAIDKMHFPAKFMNQTSDDGFYSVGIPGKKFYRFTDWKGLDVVQYADMVNGAYYVVTRIKTNSLLWGHSTDLVYKKIDSFMYENVPGKLLKKTPVTRNGYKGWEILNRTRRGDYQRYNILVTPFEIIVFKMSGNGDFINHGTEAQQFFGSIKLKEFKPAEWTKYQPPTGGFSVQLPHQPSLLKDQNYGADRLEYAAFDKNGNSYCIIQSSLHNYSYAEEDTFELNLMDDSYGSSSFIDGQLSHHFTKQNGYPALDAKYLHKDGSYSSVRYVIRGPLHYVITAHYKNDDEAVKQFFQSFSIVPFIYPDLKRRVDTVMHYTVNSPVFMDSSKAKEQMNDFTRLLRMDFDEEDDEESIFGNNSFKSAFIGNDTIGEKIFVTYTPPSKYAFVKDTTKKFWKGVFGRVDDEDSSLVFRMDKQYVLPNGTKIRELSLTDTGSSRLIIAKWIYRNGHLFTLTSLTDTLSVRSSFLQNFFSSFAPADTLKGEAVFARKTEQFFKEFFSADTAIAKQARKAMHRMDFDSLDLPYLKAAIDQLNWSHKNYLNTKEYFIGQLGRLKDSTVIPYLRQLYFQVKDTAELQHIILNALLRQKTKDAFIAFRDLITQEPPILDDSYAYRYRGFEPAWERGGSDVSVIVVDDDDDNQQYGPWSRLYDTLSLTKAIFPGILQLMDVEDYKESVMALLTTMVDSGYLKAADYENHFSKLYLDARQLLKKQIASEEQDNIEKLNRKDKDNLYRYYDEDEEEEMDRGNNELEQYSILLLPFYDKNPGIPQFFNQLLQTRDRELLFKTFVLLLRNNRPVPDSLFMKYARADEYRSELYKELAKMKKLDKFPSAFKTQEQIARSLFLDDKSSHSKPDTVVYLDKLPLTYKNEKGFVYFFKYKQARDDNYWRLASVGMQPDKQDSIDVNKDDFTDESERKLDTNKPVKEQLEKMLKELLNSKRESASEFYDSRRYNLYKTYLPDIVKGSRYRD